MGSGRTFSILPPARTPGHSDGGCIFSRIAITSGSINTQGVFNSALALNMLEKMSLFRCANFPVRYTRLGETLSPAPGLPLLPGSHSTNAT